MRLTHRPCGARDAPYAWGKSWKVDEFDSKRRAIKPLFLQGPSLTTRLVVFVSASLIMMTVDHRQNYLENVRTALSSALYPVYYVINLPVTAGGWMQENFTTRIALMQENTRLHQQATQIKSHLQKMAALEAENERLRKLLDAAPKVSERILAAELLAVDIDPYARKIVIDKGGRDGVYEGQPVVDADGVMGQVIRVNPLYSTAMLITDTGHSLPVMVNRTGYRTIAAGTGASGQLELQHVASHIDIKPGDLLVTSGLDGRFPPNYPVAKVILAKQEAGQFFLKVKAEPTAHLEHNREVLLVWPKPDGGLAMGQPQTPAATPQSPSSAAPQNPIAAAPATPVTATPSRPVERSGPASPAPASAAPATATATATATPPDNIE